MDLLQRFASVWCGTTEAEDIHLVSVKLLDGLLFPDGEELFVITCLPGGRSVDPLRSLCCWSLIYPLSKSKDNQWNVNKGGELFTRHIQDPLRMGHRQIQIASYCRENISSDPE